MRAMYAADLLARAHGLNVISLPELREINMGEWEGRPLKEISTLYPEMIAQLFHSSGEFQYPKGESFSEFECRIRHMKLFGSDKGPLDDLPGIILDGACGDLIVELLRRRVSRRCGRFRVLNP
jgi:hypothetical protein